MLFDTHAHLDDRKFDGDRDAAIQKIFQSGVSYVVNAGADLPSSRHSVALAQQYDGIYAAVGVHPHDAKTMQEDDLATLKALAAHPKVVAIGEIGLDYYYDNSPRDVQQYWFKRQLELAEELELPIIIHDRDAHGDTLSLLGQSTARGIVHCFSGSVEMAKQLTDMGFYLGFGGPLTYKNSKQAVQAASQAPLDRLLIETDSPYLAPEGHRGQRNDSSLVRVVCERMAQLRGLTTEQMAQITMENAKRVYGL